MLSWYLFYRKLHREWVVLMQDADEDTLRRPAYLRHVASQEACEGPLPSLRLDRFRTIQRWSCRLHLRPELGRSPVC
jgi:hypothetical protein